MINISDYTEQELYSYNHQTGEEIGRKQESTMHLLLKIPNTDSNVREDIYITNTNMVIRSVESGDIITEYYIPDALAREEILNLVERIGKPCLGSSQAIELAIDAGIVTENQLEMALSATMTPEEITALNFAEGQNTGEGLKTDKVGKVIDANHVYHGLVAGLEKGRYL